MKISSQNVKSENRFIQSKFCLKFKVEQSIPLPDFKKLMLISGMYDASAKTGYILKGKEQQFKTLCLGVEKVDDSQCKASHEKASEKRMSKASNADFEEWVEDVYGQPVWQMPTQDAAKLRKEFSNN